MTTFAEWKNLPPVRDMVSALVEIDFDGIETWSGYKSAVYFADRSDIRSRANEWCQMRERVEVGAFMGVLRSMDYADLAHETAQDQGFDNLLRIMNYADDDHRRVLAGALEQQD